MFRNLIRETPMTTQGADEYFSDRIYGASYEGDTTFLGTLRALLDTRMPEGDTILLAVDQGSMDRSVIESRPYDNVFRRVAPNMPIDSSNVLYVNNFCRCDADSCEAFIKLLRSSFTKMYGNGWQILEDVTTLYKKTFDCVCFINPELKSTAVFVTDMNMRKYHYLQCAILGMLPWYFDREKGITKDESDLIYSLREKTPDKYNEAIAKFAAKYDFETGRLKRLLQGFESRYERKQIDDLTNEIATIRRQINDLNDAIERYVRQMYDSNIRLMGLKAVVESKPEDSELMRYFQRNKSLYLEGVRGSALTFCTKGVITYFDPAIASHMIEAGTSYVYEHCARNCVGKKDVHDLMVKAFVDQEVQIKFCAAYSFNINGTVKALTRHEFPASFADYMPNPHIDRYECLGNHLKPINNLLKEGKYIEAIEQCIASSRSLNFADVCVMSAFFETILSENRNCFILPDGTETNIRGALEWVVKNREPEEPTEEGNDVEDN